MSFMLVQLHMGHAITSTRSAAESGSCSASVQATCAISADWRSSTCMSPPPAPAAACGGAVPVGTGCCPAAAAGAPEAESSPARLVTAVALHAAAAAAVALAAAVADMWQGCAAAAASPVWHTMRSMREAAEPAGTATYLPGPRGRALWTS